MSKQDDITNFPLAGLEVRTVEAYDALIITPQFLASPMSQDIHSDRNFIVTREMATEMIGMLQRGVEKLESASVAIPPDEKH